MTSLPEKSPLDGTARVSVGGVTLAEVPVTKAVLIAAFPGRGDAAAREFESATGLAFPEPDRVSAKDGVVAVWTGPAQALVFGDPPEIAGAARIDQSDGVARLALEGGGARDVLARLVPLDLREASFPAGAGARTLLGHIPAGLLRTAEARFEILVPRSMAASAVHDLTRAMRGVAARG